MNFLGDSQHKTLDHYISNIMSIRPNEQEMASTLRPEYDACPPKGRNKPYEDSGPDTLSNYLGDAEIPPPK